MMKEQFNPVYNSVEQVKSCAGYMLGEEIVDARIALVIGHNGRNFVSSTDWRLTTESGAHRILPFSMRPQYPNFLECVAGVSYRMQDDQLVVLPDSISKEMKYAVVNIGNRTYTFKVGDALKVYVEPNSHFIATDCAVLYSENHLARVFDLVTDNNTVHGFLDDSGRISRAY